MSLTKNFEVARPGAQFIAGVSVPLIIGAALMTSPYGIDGLRIASTAISLISIFAGVSSKKLRENGLPFGLGTFASNAITFPIVHHF